MPVIDRLPQLRVDVTKSSESMDSEILIRPYMPATPLNSVPAVPTTPYPLTLVARARHVYFIPRETFDVFAMFRNPLMVIMVLTVVMMLGMPYLMVRRHHFPQLAVAHMGLNQKNLDPEVLEEFKQRQARVARLQSSLQDGDIRGRSACV